MYLMTNWMSSVNFQRESLVCTLVLKVMVGCCFRECTMCEPASHARQTCEALENTLVSLNSTPVSINSTSVSLQLALR